MAEALNKYKILYAHYVEPIMVTSFGPVATNKSLLPMRKAFKREHSWLQEVMIEKMEMQQLQAVKLIL